MPDAFPHLHIVLLCEDYGSRLWPVAREDAPACLAPVEPGSETSLLATAVERAVPFTDAPLHVVTTQQLAPVIENELLAHMEASEADWDVDLLVEPVARGSAVAVALATERIRREDPAAVVAVFPSNQVVEADDRWEHLMYRAYLAALQDRLVVLGGQQDGKCADYTFIRKAGRFEGMDDTYAVRRFSVHAQPAAAARAKCEGALWYTGVVFAKAAVLMGELARAGEYAYTVGSRGSKRIAETAKFLSALEPAYWLKTEAKEVIEALPSVSLEEACLEVSEKLVVVATTVPFSTLSSLEDLEATAHPDRQGNRVLGRGTLESCRDTTVYSQEEGRRVVALGLRDAMIIDTGDTLLVVDKKHLDELPDVL